MERWRCQQEELRTLLLLLPGIYRLDLLPVAASLSVPHFIIGLYWKRQSGAVERLTKVAEAAIESRVTQTGSVGPVAAAIVGTVALFMAQFPVEALGTACTPGTNQQAI